MPRLQEDFERPLVKTPSLSGSWVVEHSNDHGSGTFVPDGHESRYGHCPHPKRRITRRDVKHFFRDARVTDIRERAENGQAHGLARRSEPPSKNRRGPPVSELPEAV